MKNSLINYAGSRGRITLTTSEFARGTDFMVYDSEINDNGGMHVIQAYVSKR
jgi:preprotein translocase subunit SecA